MEDKYYTPSFNEFIPGFECETNYEFFTNYGEEEWVKIKMTEEFLNNYLGLIKADAYESEFRARK